MNYNFSEIERRWKQYWEEHGTNAVRNDSKKPKYYVLSMFPYPSGAGLHMGHPIGYTAADIFARYKRMKGFNVLHPMGFDAFGLPAEQYAIETGQHPAKTTEENINQFKAQLKNIGLSYDWDREVQTCDPDYYKWTQWLFLKIYNSWYNLDKDKAEPISSLIERFEVSGNKKVVAATEFEEKFTDDEWKAMDDYQKEAILLNYRLAYLAYADVNWCPALGTVLANDEVRDGVSERGGHPVERIKMRQWYLRITAYAQRLLDGLDTVEFSEAMKDMQRNWIGRSEGATIDFPLEGIDASLRVFTTRPDTIFGATFMVIAPEHELLSSLTTEDQKKEVEAYINHVKSRSDIQRQAEKEVTGVFTGSYALNPLNEQKIPIWIAEYVLIGYGTGAIMAVPADDDRDHAFAEKFGLPIIEVIDRSAYPDAAREDKVGKMINSEFLNGMEVMDAIYTVCLKLEDMEIGKKKVNFRLRDAGFSRQRYWGEPFPIVYKNDVPFQIDESELPLILPEVQSYKPSGNPESPLAQNKDWVNLPDGSIRETDTMPGYAGSSWYFLRYMDPGNQERFVGEEAEEYWQDVDLYLGGAEHAVGHLMYSRFWHKVLYDLGMVSTKEPYKKLVNQGMIQSRSSIVYRVNGANKFVSHGLKDSYETTPIHVDIRMVMNDVLDLEQFRAWRQEYADAEFILEEGKYICGHDIEKMSKRWHNVINPNDVVDQYGADCLRMYLMFLGPIEAHKPWDTKGIDGVSKFLRKLWRMFYKDDGTFRVTNEEATKDELKVLHKTIKKVAEDIEKLSFNTGVSAFMICVNELNDLKCYKRSILRDLVVALAPYAPFITEELWKALGNEESVFNQSFPEFDKKILKEESYAYPISINGKVRAKINLPLDLKQNEVEKEVMNLEDVMKWTDGKDVRKIIFVPGRIINVVV